MELIIQILQEAANFSGIGVLALFIIAFIIAMQKGIISKEGIKNIRNGKECPPDSLNEVKEILKLMADSISGPKGLKGNDLNHIQQAIENIGVNVKDLSLEMGEFNKNFEKHDRQAWEINEGIKSIKGRLKIPVE